MGRYRGGYTRSHFGPPQPGRPVASVGDYCAALPTPPWSGPRAGLGHLRPPDHCAGYDCSGAQSGLPRLIHTSMPPPEKTAQTRNRPEPPNHRPGRFRDSVSLAGVTVGASGCYPRGARRVPFSNCSGGSGRMQEKFGRLLCWLGVHRFHVVDATFGFGCGGAVETVECQRCGLTKTRRARSS